MAKISQHIIILGEQPLVDEMKNVCSHHGFAVRHFTKTLPRSAVCAFELTNTDLLQKRTQLQKLDKIFPPSKFIFSSSVTVTIAEQATWIRHPERLIGISALPSLLSNSLLEVALPLQVSSASVKTVQSFLQSLGKEITIIQDRIGMVTPRVLCMIINEAFFALMEEIASPKDIDIAMKLGTNYPNGPVEWATKITFKQLISVLLALHSDLGEERYRISPLLRQMALRFS